MAINTLLNYNRSANNISDSATIPVNTSTPVLLAELGLFVPQAVNFIELIATIGWSSDPGAVEANQSNMLFFITQDDIVVASTREESPDDAGGGDLDLFITTTFQGVLTNVATGHHVYRLFAQNLEPGQSIVNIEGPVTISVKAIGPEA
ncbi:hypothetical protein [Aneurinibacillus sp. REN35]|uniref:hypothetical protein n=1 Tax=Aneurinibacillus sp. REN35 TaxID=3237286 RepID=UPI003527D02A